MLIPLSIISEIIFLEPQIIFYVTDYNALGFSLIVFISALTGLVLSMGIYRIRVLRTSKRKMSSGFLGSIIGASAGACGCGSIGFAIITTFGAIGSAATSFASTYEIPLRIVSIVILGATYFYTVKGLTKECKISFNNKTS